MLEAFKPGGILEDWNRREASKYDKSYYSLPDDATLADVILCIRADEAMHREVNHLMADLPVSSQFEYTRIEIQEEIESEIKEDYRRMK